MFLNWKAFFWIPAYATDAAAVNPNDINAILVDDVNIFLANVKLIFNNGSRKSPRNSPDWMIFDICVFNNFTLIAELFAKALSIFETCQSFTYI